MSLFGSVLGLGTSALSGVLGGVGDVASSWATNSAKESLNKNVLKTNMKYQKEYDLWTQQQDKAYEQWWQQYLYDLQNNEYYNLARKYATNTASWAVEGLKKSGLNPILAGIDSNLSSSMGNAAPNQSGHSLGSRSVHGASVSGGHNITTGLNIAQAMQAASASQVSETEADIKKKTAPSVIETSRLTPAQISANTAKTLAEAKLIEAQAGKTQVDTKLSAAKADNEVRNAGSPNGWGALNRVFDSVSNGDPLRGAGSAIDKAADMINNLLSVPDTYMFPNSSKEQADKFKDNPIQINPAAVRYSDEELAIILETNGLNAMADVGFSQEQMERAYKYWDDHPKSVKADDKYRLNTPRAKWKPVRPTGKPVNFFDLW